MTSGRRLPRTGEFLRLAAGSIALIALQSGSASPVSWGLPQLMALLTHEPHHDVRFVERRYLHVLTQPLESSGRLSFTPPQRIEETILTPKKETLVVDGDTLLVRRANNSVSTVELPDHPEIKTLIDSIRGTLSGNLSMLRGNYTVTVQGDAHRWRLLLVPLPRDAAAVVSKIRISGAGGDVSMIEFRFPNGDRSEMTITQIQSP